MPAASEAKTAPEAETPPEAKTAPEAKSPPRALDRRSFLGLLPAAGLGAPAAMRGLGEQEGEITSAGVAATEDLLGLEYTAQEREMMLPSLAERREMFEAVRAFSIPNGVAPPLYFDPALPGTEFPPAPGAVRMSRSVPETVPDDLEELAFLPVTHLSELIRTRNVSSEAVTRMYLTRLRRHAAELECVVSFTEELALRQARQADRELARGHHRGPLHGIPWGAKDLFAARGYKTTWGAAPYRDQFIDDDAAVVRRLEEAGAVLIAKLSMGALAQGDVWFGGRTRNPWLLEQGSRGSSAGSAAATAAGLVGFAMGTETLGSIISPSARCGCTGLRPTFGRVSRAGAMTLSWTMDKAGPLCRSVEDCAIVLDAIQGPDGRDLAVRAVPFSWDGSQGVHGLRVGYLGSAFEEGRDVELQRPVLEVLRGAGVELFPVSLPGAFPLRAIYTLILHAEQGAVFDELTRSDRDDLLVRQTPRARPDRLRQAHFIPGVEYLQANRLRTMLMEAMQQAMLGVDVFVSPTFAADVSIITNLTGHPAMALPCGFREDGTPASISFIGGLYRDGDVMRVAKAYQDATDHHARRPPLFG